jgi:hypothetical protein
VELLAFQTLSVKPQGSTLSSSLSTSESNKNKSSSSSSNPQNTNNPLPQNRLNLSTSATKSQTISPRSQPESSPRPSTKDQQSKSPSNLTSEISELNLVGFEESVSSDVLSAEYREINIPIRLVNEWHEFQQTSGSSGSDVSSVIDNALDMLVELQKSLWDEERESYYSSIKSRSDRHPFVCLHSAAVYQKALCRLLEYSCSPLLLLLQERRSFNQTKVRLSSLSCGSFLLISDPFHFLLLIVGCLTRRKTKIIEIRRNNTNEPKMIRKLRHSII